MPSPLILLSIPGLRAADLDRMQALQSRNIIRSRQPLQHSFPAVTWPAQATLLTGKLPREHGVIANGFYWRDRHEVEMWTAWNEVIESPQIWDALKQQNPELKTAAWFPMLSKGCGADYVCMPAPIHRPDGSEEMWCYSKPQSFYGELLAELGPFPLHHFWGPLANIESTRWIVESYLACHRTFQPDFAYIYLPHLDYQAQKFGPDSSEAIAAVGELDAVVDRLIGGVLESSPPNAAPDWLVLSEYVISPVEHVSYPNRILREEGWLKVLNREGRDYLDFENSIAWALVDHQFSHVFVKDRNPDAIRTIAERFEEAPGIGVVAAGDQRAHWNLDHPRAGDLLLISEPDSWQAYYWWLEDAAAPDFATAVDIHRKPGYDPVELFMDRATRSVPLDATLIRGSHGLPTEPGVIASSASDLLPEGPVQDTDLFDRILDRFR